MRWIWVAAWCFKNLILWKIWSWCGWLETGNSSLMLHLKYITKNCLEPFWTSTSLASTSLWNAKLWNLQMSLLGSRLTRLALLHASLAITLKELWSAPLETFQIRFATFYFSSLFVFVLLPTPGPVTHLGPCCCLTSLVVLPIPRLDRSDLHPRPLQRSLLRLQPEDSSWIFSAIHPCPGW